MDTETNLREDKIFKGYGPFLELYRSGAIKEGTAIGIIPSASKNEPSPNSEYIVFNEKELYIKGNGDVSAPAEHLLNNYNWRIAPNQDKK